MKRTMLVCLALLVSIGFVFGGGESETSDRAKADSKELTLYYSHPAGWTDPIIKEFQERTGIRVDLVGAGTGELAARIRAEKDNPLADVLWGGGSPTYEGIIDLLEPYQHAYMDDVYPESRDPGNRWHASTTDPMVIIYNPKLVAPEDAPKGWADLLNPKFKGRIAHADPTKSSSAFMALTIQLQTMGGDNETGWKYMADFVDNLDGKLLGSSSGTFKGVSDGEYAVGITYEEAALKYLRAGADLKVVYPIEGTINFPGPIAIVKGCKNLESAKQFLDFIFSKDVQSLLGDSNKRSVRKDVEFPSYMIPNDSPQFVPYSTTLLENNDVQIKKWKDLIVGK